MKRFGILISEFGTSIAVIFIIALIGFLFSSNASAMLTTTVNHDHITIDFFYHGSTLSVRGVSESGVDIIVKMTAPEEHQVLKQKGKIAGMLWMNVGTMKFEHVPNFYAVYSSKKLEDVLNPAEMEKYTLGYSALEKHVEVTPVANEEEKAKWFSEFVKFKENSRVYAVSYGKIEIKQNSDGKQNYSILTDWPYQAQPGDYLITVYAVKDGKIVEQAESKVNVEQIGVVKTLATMAKNNAAFYGILSIGIALCAGFGVSLVFRKGGGSH
jgi:uncharacterized protein (TIGR02186 family)